MNVDISQIANLITSLIKMLPALIAYLVIAKLAYGLAKTWRGPINPVDAAYSLAAVAAFAYVIR